MELETDDLAALPDLNEESLLVYLKARYKHDIIYVWIKQNSNNFFLPRLITFSVI